MILSTGNVIIDQREFSATQCMESHTVVFFKRLSPVSLSVLTLAPDISFEEFSSAFGKNPTVCCLLDHQRKQNKRAIKNL